MNRRCPHFISYYISRSMMELPAISGICHHRRSKLWTRRKSSRVWNWQISEAQELGMDMWNYVALLEELRDGWDGLEEDMKG